MTIKSSQQKGVVYNVESGLDIKYDEIVTSDGGILKVSVCIHIRVISDGKYSSFVSGKLFTHLNPFEFMR